MVGVSLPTPVRLQEDAVDLLEVDSLRLISDSFHHGCDAEVSDASDHSFARSCDEVECLVGEGVVAECDLVELLENELDGVIRREFLQHDRVGDAASEIVVDA